MNNFIDHEPDLTRVTAAPAKPAECADGAIPAPPPRPLVAAPDVVCYENYNLYCQLIDASAELIPDGSPLLGLIAKQFTSSCWREERQAAVSVDAIDIRVGEDYDTVKANYPNADARLHGSLANMELLKSGMADKTDRAIARAVNISRTKLNVLEGVIRLREKHGKS